jgi:hypothetical protein
LENGEIVVMKEYVRKIYLNIAKINSNVMKLSVYEKALRQLGLNDSATDIGKSLKTITRNCDALLENLENYRNSIALSEKIMLLVLENENEALKEINGE